MPCPGRVGGSRVVSAHTRACLSLRDVGQSPLLSSLRSESHQDPRHRYQAGDTTTETDVTQLGVYISLELPPVFPLLLKCIPGLKTPSRPGWLEICPACGSVVGMR